MNEKPFYRADSQLPTQQNYVIGAYLANTDGETFGTRHPGYGKLICQVEVAGQTEIDAAVAAAKEAFAGWAATPAAERGNILRRAAGILRKRNQELAELETLDTGKGICETSAVDIISGAEVIEYFAGVARSPFRANISTCHRMLLP